VIIGVACTHIIASECITPTGVNTNDLPIAALCFPRSAHLGIGELPAIPQIHLTRVGVWFIRFWHYIRGFSVAAPKNISSRSLYITNSGKLTVYVNELVYEHLIDLRLTR
jgi:hypothetical protein